jgi:hypothetical protein
MPSELIVPIVEIDAIRSHGNADRLEIVELFICCPRKRAMTRWTSERSKTCLFSRKNR